MDYITAFAVIVCFVAVIYRDKLAKFFSPILWVVFVFLLLSISCFWFLNNYTLIFADFSPKMIVTWGTLIVLGQAYTMVAVNAVRIGKECAALITNLLRKDKEHSFWVTLDRLRAARVVAIAGLVIVAIISLIILLSLPGTVDVYVTATPVALVVAGVFLIGGVIRLASKERFIYELADHQETRRISQLIHNISIAAGVASPSYKVFKHTSPNALTVANSRGEHTIYFSVALINILDDRELEAVIAHEVAHIVTGQSLFRKWFSMLLFLTNLLALAVFLLYFMQYAPFVLFGLLIISAYAVVIESDIFLFNPVQTFLKIAGKTVEYFVTYNEDLYADTYAIQLLRRPDTLFSALRKVRKHMRKAYLSELYMSSYFAGDNSVYSRAPMPQPPISVRLAHLMIIDKSLLTEEQSEVTVSCPNCFAALKPANFIGHYGRPILVEKCVRCAGVWFDSLEFNSIADKDLLISDGEVDIQENKDPLRCPHCNSVLEVKTERLSKNKWTRHACPTCMGYWMSKNNIIDAIKLKI